jgi:hypothetical protein
MLNSYRRVAVLAVTALVALAIATPASAQFGSLRKKVKAKTVQETPPAAESGAPADQGGTIVLTSDVVAQLLTGLKARLSVTRPPRSPPPTVNSRGPRLHTLWHSPSARPRIRP